MRSGPDYSTGTGIAYSLLGSVGPRAMMCGRPRIRITETHADESPRGSRRGDSENGTYGNTVREYLPLFRPLGQIISYYTAEVPVLTRSSSQHRIGPQRRKGRAARRSPVGSRPAICASASPPSDPVPRAQRRRGRRRSRDSTRRYYWMYRYGGTKPRSKQAPR